MASSTTVVPSGSSAGAGSGPYLENVKGGETLRVDPTVQHLRLYERALRQINSQRRLIVTSDFN